MRQNFVYPNAVAHIEGNDVKGRVEFYQKPDGVLVSARINGLPKSNGIGFFGFHIHEGGACSGVDFADTGMHYNPKGTEHPRHSGDLPPLLSCDGNAYMSVLTNRFSVREVVGKTVVIHSNADDFHSQPAGNAGKKIACGIIKRV